MLKAKNVIIKKFGKHVDKGFVFYKIQFKNPQNFEVEGPNVTNNSLTCKDDIQGGKQ